MAKPVPENLHLDVLNIFHDLFDIHLVVIERKAGLTLCFVKGRLHFLSIRNSADSLATATGSCLD